MLFQHLWISATIMQCCIWRSNLRHLRSIPWSFKPCCAGCSFSWEGMESPQWGPGAGGLVFSLGQATRTGSTAGKCDSSSTFSNPPLSWGDPQGDFPQLLTRVSWSQPGSCRDASLEVSLPLPSPLRANHFCGLFWDPFHFCNSLGHAEQKGQITPLQNAIVLASLFPALVCTSPSFARPSCLWVKQKEHVLFCFISLPVLAHGQIVSQLPTVLVPSTSPHNGHKFSGGPDPQALCAGALPALAVALPPNRVLCKRQCWPFSTDAWEKFLLIRIHISLSLQWPLFATSLPI